MKRVILSVIFFCIFTAIFSSLFFTFVDDYSATRWISYILIHLAWVVLIINFYQFPEVEGGVIFGYAKQRMAYILFVVELLLGVLFIFINNDSYVIPVLFQAIPFLLNMAGYIALMSSESHSKAADRQDAQNRAFMREASTVLESTMKFCTDWNLSKKIETLLDAVKSSKLKCLPEAAGAEERFMKIVYEINGDVIAGNIDGLEQKVKEATVILEQRNMIIKSKGL